MRWLRSTSGCLQVCCANCSAHVAASLRVSARRCWRMVWRSVRLLINQVSKRGGCKFRRASSTCTVATVAPEPKVQEGDSNGPFRLSAHDGHAHRYHIKSPGLEIRLKEILAAIAYSRGCPNLISPSTSVHLRLPITGKCIFNPGIQFPEPDTGRIAANYRP